VTISTTDIVNQNFVKVCINGVLIPSLVDTGAARTLVSEELALLLGVPIEKLPPNKCKLLFTADGTRMHLREKTVLSLKINELTFHKEAYVVRNLSHRLILGLDFLQDANAVVDCRRRTVTFNDDNVNVSLQRVRRDYGDEPVMYARSLRTTTVPPLTEALIPISLPARFNDCNVLLETTPSLQFQPFGCARAIVHCTRGKSVCKILNPTLKTLTLHRNKNLAVVERLDTIATCHPFTDKSETSAQQDFTVRESRETLDKFHNDYAFKLNPELSDEHKYELLQVLYNHRTVFARDLSEIKVYPHYQMELEAMDNRKCYRRQFKLALDDSVEVERQLEDLKARGVLEPTDNCEFNAPVFLVDKKDGKKRLVVDLRQINDILVPRLLPLPKIDDLLGEICLGGSEYLTTLDMFSGYLQLKVAKESRKYLAITNPATGERLAYARVPFGLQQSPAALIKVLNQVFSGCRKGSGTYIYMDDIAIASRDWQHHLSTVSDVLQKLAANQLSCNPTKCALAYFELSFLGHSISAKGMRIAKEKFPVITRMAPPRNRKSLQRLIGLLNYFRKFVRNFAQRTANMRHLLKADQAFEWTSECQNELNDLKECLLSDPLLVPLDPSKRIVVLCDASNSGYGFSILQRASDGQLHPVFFGGAALSPAEVKYTPAHKELAALVLAFKSIEHLASLTDISVLTDNSSVLYYKKWTPQTPRLKRIICYLQQFSFEIRHIAGCKNMAADCLSRIYDDMQFTDRVELQRNPDREEFLVVADHGPPEMIRDAPVIVTDTRTDDIQATAADAAVTPDTRPPATIKIVANAATQTDHPYDGTMADAADQLTTTQRDMTDRDAVIAPLTMTDPEMLRMQCDRLCRVAVDETETLLKQTEIATGETIEKSVSQESIEQTQTEQSLAENQDADGLTARTDNDSIAPLIAPDMQTPHTWQCDRLGSDVIDGGVERPDPASAPVEQLLQHQSDVSDDRSPAWTGQTYDRDDLSDGWIDGDAELDDDTADTTNLADLEQKVESGMSLIYDDAESGFTENDYLEDAEFGDVYRYLKDGTLSGNDRTDKTTLLASEFYFLRKSRLLDQSADLLYKVKLPKHKGILPLTIDRLCVPKRARAEILFRAHDICVHSGRQKTYLTVSNRFYWRSLFADVHSYVKSCEVCQKSRRNYAHRVAPLHPLEVPDRPFSHIAIDFKNLTRRTTEGNIAILVVVCQFSFYPYLIPTKDLTAQTTARALIEHVICAEGCPRVINTDRGVNFTSDLFRYLTRFLHARHRISASKSARTNGACELVVQRMSNMLKRFEADDLAVEQCLPLITLALRASSLTTMPYSPYEIVRGRRMFLGGGPIDPSDSIPFDGQIGRYIKAFRRELNAIHADVKRAKLEIKRQDALAYNKHNKARQTFWQIGDRVLLQDKTIKPGSNKILTKRPYVGPYYISEVVEGDGFGATYRLIDEKTGRTYRYLVNQDRLKRYFDNKIEMEGRLTQAPRKVQLKPLVEQIIDEPDDSPTSEQMTDANGHADGGQTDAAARDETDADDQQLIDDDNAPVYGYEPALCIKRQRTRNGKIEYLCEFEDRSLWWSRDVSDLLLKNWRLQQAKERAKKARKRRQMFKT